MIWRNTENVYGMVHISLHWTAALMIVVLLPLGLWMTGLDYYNPWYRKAPDLHRAIGVLLGLVMLIRIGWSLSSIKPAPLASRVWENHLAGAVQRLLYLLPLLLIISGYLISTADGRAVDVFGWFEIPATLHGIEGQEDIAGDIHFALAMVLLTLITLHALAALRHHFVLKDDTLRRMVKPVTRTKQTGKQA